MKFIVICYWCKHKAFDSKFDIFCKEPAAALIFTEPRGTLSAVYPGIGYVTFSRLGQYLSTFEFSFLLY